MQIEVRVFAHFVDYLPPADRKEKASRIKIRTGSRIIDVIEQLGIPRGEVSLVMRNDEQSSVEQKLKDGDTVGIFPPIAGGLDEQLEAGIGSKYFPFAVWDVNTNSYRRFTTTCFMERYRIRQAVERLKI